MMHNNLNKESYFLHFIHTQKIIFIYLIVYYRKYQRKYNKLKLIKILCILKLFNLNFKKLK